MPLAYLSFNLSLQIQKKLHFSMISAVSLLTTSFFKINYFHCVFSWGFVRLFHAVFTSVCFTVISIFLNKHIADIEKSDEICSPTFVVDEFWGLFLHPSNCYIKHLKST